MARRVSNPFGPCCSCFFQGAALAVALAGLLVSAGCTGLTESSSPSKSAVSVTPAVVSFGNVVVGSTNSQTMTLSNQGTSDVTVSGVTASGAGFAISGLATPVKIGGGDSVTFTTSYHPSAAGVSSGSISIASSLSNLAVSLSGTGVAASMQISASTTSISFGNVALGTPSSQQVTLTNTGNANVTVSSVSVSGAGLSTSGGSNVTLSPGQSTNVTVTFTPQAAGAVTGSLSIGSNATDSVLQVQLSGTGVSAQHTVGLNWTPSSSIVAGYFVYRGSVSGGPYSKLNALVDALASYTDGTVAGGQTYFYVVTSVDSTGIESLYSNEVSVTIPSP